jgi:hypothetical protein
MYEGGLRKLQNNDTQPALPLAAASSYVNELTLVRFQAASKQIFRRNIIIQIQKSTYEHSQKLGDIIMCRRNQKSAEFIQ